MMRKHFFLNLTAIGYLSFFMNSGLNAQLDPHDPFAYYHKVFRPHEVDMPAQFPGGKLALIDYLNTWLKYPLMAREFAIEGTG